MIEQKRYMSRIELDPLNRRTLSALMAPNLIHGAIETAFGKNNKRRLWRVDHYNGKRFLLVLSEDVPELSSVAEQFGTSGSGWNTKEYSSYVNSLAKGMVLRFRLAANPSVNVITESDGEQIKQIKSHVTIEQQKEWLAKRAESYGFSLDEQSFDVVGSKWFKFKKNKDSKFTVNFKGTEFEGFLKITDIDKFRETLLNGLGREKAYGMGMLTVA